MRFPSRRFWSRFALALVAVLAAIQLVPYGRAHANPPVLGEPAWDSPETRALAARACFDCHSNQVKWPAYSHVAPVSWLVQRDVDEARAHLNFSEWTRPQEDADEAAEEVREGEMPLKIYALMHANAGLRAGGRTRPAAVRERARGRGGSGGRAPLLIGLTICVVFFVGPRIRGRSRVPRLLGMAALAMAAAGLLVLVAPTQAANQVSFYAQSLNPTSEKSEWDWRWAAYTEGITLGIQKSSWLGRGAGTHSVGLQYLLGGSANSVKAVGYEVESGWGAVAIELGKIGLALWVIWSIVWSRRLMASLKALRGQPDAQAALPLVAYVLLALFVLFFTGYQSFQNYIVNANIWLMSGIVFGMGAAASRTVAAEAAETATPPELR